MATPRKIYSPHLKAAVVREIWRETRSISQIAAQYGIHPNQLYTWRDQAATSFPDLFTDTAAQTLAEQAAAHAAEVEQLYAQIGRLTTEVSWLKKSCNASPTHPGEFVGSPAARAGAGPPSRSAQLKPGAVVLPTGAGPGGDAGPPTADR
jgi:putative transposase